TSYGKPWRLEGLFLLLILGCFFGGRENLNRIILAWAVPIGIYVLWFVSPKPDHYLLPLMVPMSSAVLTLINAISPWLAEKDWRQYAGWGLVFLFALFIAPQLVFHIAQSYALFMEFFV